ncbi:RcnB family protein [Sphingobium scionense]|uniref:RcnB family protein n=1 Tax=Novosphingobium silvae TaxID=2692619 RepID=A0A7X4GDR8_9SPHN|nr:MULTISPECIES: RcnB family protein [Sphingomonadaceae]MYL96763.1 hypothetical protein [Novosphingobium silvae]
MFRWLVPVVAVSALALSSSPSLAQSRERSVSVQGPHGRGGTVQRSVERRPGGASVERSLDTNDGRHFEASRSAAWGGGYYSGSRTVTGPNGGTVTRRATVDAWHRPLPPAGYWGPRRGYYFAPGYGYFPVTAPYYARPWTIGAIVPVSLRRYYVPVPAVYGLPVAPVGHSWIFVGNRTALVAGRTGVIVRLGPVFW